MANDDLILTDAPRGGLPRWTAVTSVLLSMGAIVGTGVTEVFFAPRKPILMGDERDAMDKANANVKWSDGSLARSIETDFRLRGRVRRYVAPFWSTLLFKAGDTPNRKVIIGRDEYLFFRQRVELDYVNKPIGPSILASLCAAADRSLAAWGSALVVVPLPRKGVACRSRLPEGVKLFPEFDAKVVQTMQQRGVRVVDLVTPWTEWESDGTKPALYPSHETHWSRAGVQSFADEVARQVPALPRDTTSIEIVEGPLKETTSNLRFVGVRQGHPSYAWSNPQNRPSLLLTPPGRENLMDRGEERAEILLAGSSFSAGFFAQAVLAATLQTPVVSSSLKGRMPLTSLHKGLLRFKPDEIPAFAITELPIHQAASIGPRSDPTVRAVYAIANHLDAPDRESTLAREAFPSRLDAPSVVGRSLVKFPNGTLLSSGDGAMSVRLKVQGSELSRWRVISSGMSLPIKIPPGDQTRIVPLIEGLTREGAFMLVPMDAAAAKSTATVEVVTDADLASARALEGARDTDSTWTFRGPRGVNSHDAIILQWDETLDGAFSVSAHGTLEDGAPLLRSWSFKEAAGARIAIFSLGAAGGATLGRVEVRGAGATLTCALAPQKLTK